MSNNAIQEARRQIEVCNACRYCEGYCSVFPAINRERNFSNADVKQLANLCHNCRGCYYACQYTEPHEFALNIPKALAEVRQESWEQYAWPGFFIKHWQRNGVLIALAMILGFALLLGLILTLDKEGTCFYAALSHEAMIAIFIPAFMLPLLNIFISLRRYWNDVGGRKLTLNGIHATLKYAATMKDLDGGHGEGCNFEKQDRFSNARRWAHQLTLYGFLLCFAATSVATLMHYVFSIAAPYPLFSLPKLLGISGGLMLSAGTAWMVWLKLKAEKHLGDRRTWSGELAFVLLLFWVSTSGLLLYTLGGTTLMMLLLAFHLGSVLAFFLLMPYSKMLHGFYRLAALVRNEQLASRQT